MMFIAVVILAVFISSLAQILLKRGAMELPQSFLRQYLNPWVIGGYIILIVALLTNVFCLSHGVEIKQIAALEALGYLFVPLLSRLFFREPFTTRKAIAAGIVIIGVAVFFS